MNHNIQQTIISYLNFNELSNISLFSNTSLFSDVSYLNYLEEYNRNNDDEITISKDVQLNNPQLDAYLNSISQLLIFNYVIFV